MEFLRWLEHSGFSMTMKENWMLYDAPLVLHTVGMAFLVGLSTAVYLRILGVASRLPLSPMEEFFPLMYAGFWLNLISGVLLFSFYPTKAATNPGFYIKMVGVVSAVVCLRRLKSQVFGNRVHLDTRPASKSDRKLAATGIFVWLATVTAGRLMAYHGISGVERESAIAVLLTTLVLLAGYAAADSLGWIGSEVDA